MHGRSCHPVWDVRQCIWTEFHETGGLSASLAVYGLGRGRAIRPRVPCGPQMDDFRWDWRASTATYGLGRGRAGGPGVPCGPQMGDFRWDWRAFCCHLGGVWARTWSCGPQMGDFRWDWPVFQCHLGGISARTWSCGPAQSPLWPSD